MRGERFALRLAAVEPFDLSGMLRSLLGCKVILGRRRFEFAELELKLVQKALLALRFNAVEFALKLLDRQLQVGDMRLGVRHLRLGLQIASVAIAWATVTFASDAARAALKVDMVTSSFICRGVNHIMGFTARAISSNSVFVDQPARDGRQLSTGFRQSIPSSR